MAMAPHSMHRLVYIQDERLWEIWVNKYWNKYHGNLQQFKSILTIGIPLESGILLGEVKQSYGYLWIAFDVIPVITINPKNVLTLVIEVRIGKSIITLIFVGSSYVPSWLTACFRKIKLVFANSHFPRLNLILTSLNVSSTYRRCSKYSSQVRLWMFKSSTKLFKTCLSIYQTLQS
jgi:hypothetical protein